MRCLETREQEVDRDVAQLWILGKIEELEAVEARLAVEAEVAKLRRPELVVREPYLLDDCELLEHVHLSLEFAGFVLDVHRGLFYVVV